MKKRIMSMFALLLFIVAIMPQSKVVKAATTEITTNVNIYKLQADSYNSLTGIVNQDGIAITDLNTLGKNVRGLAGVTFTAKEITETAYKNYLTKIPSSPATEDLISGSQDIVLPQTVETGLTSWTVVNNLVNGKVQPKYYVVYETNKPSDVSSSIAVPFVIAFPMTKSDGSQYLSEVNIYPKNTTGALPIAGKDVTKLGNNSSSYNVGEEVPFILKGSLPTNIGDYQSYNFIDTLDTDYDASKIGDTTTEVISGTTKLDATTDYKVNVTGQVVKVSLTQEGIKKLTGVSPKGQITDPNVLDNASDQSNTPFIQVTIKPTLKGTAKIGTEIINNFKISYDNNSQDTNLNEVETAYSNNVTVTTGGKVFKKTKSDGSALADAQFNILENGTIITWTTALIEANNQAISDGKFLPATVGQPIIFKSSSDGTFEIKGLAYSAQGQNGTEASTYVLNETVAPAGYQILTQTIDLTIDANSYTATPQQIVNNLRPIIPATGGIGALIFIIGGIVLVSYAYYGYKKEVAKN